VACLQVCSGSHGRQLRRHHCGLLRPSRTSRGALPAGEHATATSRLTTTWPFPLLPGPIGYTYAEGKEILLYWTLSSWRKGQMNKCARVKRKAGSFGPVDPMPYPACHFGVLCNGPTRRFSTNETYIAYFIEDKFCYLSCSRQDDGLTGDSPLAGACMCILKVAQQHCKSFLWTNCIMAAVRPFASLVRHVLCMHIVLGNVWRCKACM
jgi:hypothetical protein